MTGWTGAGSPHIALRIRVRNNVIINPKIAAENRKNDLVDYLGFSSLKQTINWFLEI